MRRLEVDPATSAIYDFIPDSLLPKVENRADFWKLIPIDVWLGNLYASRVLFYRTVPQMHSYRGAIVFRSPSESVLQRRSCRTAMTLPILAVRHYCGGGGYESAERKTIRRARSIQEKRSLLRKYGYGVPIYERAVLSSANDLTLIAEDELEPLRKDGGRLKTRNMNLHDFSWPRTQLEELGEAEVELRVTLSYFIEPNPGERGWLRRHRYASHGLRFAVKRGLESVDEFRRRINAAVGSEDEDLVPAQNGGDNWLLGPHIRNTGSIHSDYWRGTAADLAQRSSIGVYPIGGWWKENPQHERYGRRVRYALIVPIRAISGTADIYTPVAAQITLPSEITTQA